MLGMMQGDHSTIIIGWQEWCSLPNLAIPAIKIKIDTGARTAALHAENIEIHERKSGSFVHFLVYPIQRNNTIIRHCKVPLAGQRAVMSSTGHKEIRYSIKTPIVLADRTWMIDVTLTNRDPMRFRMLLGRAALRGLLIDPKKRLLLGKLKKKDIKQIYGL